MSWFRSIAQQAESLLESVDKRAAVEVSRLTEYEEDEGFDPPSREDGELPAVSKQPELLSEPDPATFSAPPQPRRASQAEKLSAKTLGSGSAPLGKKSDGPGGEDWASMLGSDGNAPSARRSSGAGAGPSAASRPPAARAGAPTPPAASRSPAKPALAAGRRVSGGSAPRGGAAQESKAAGTGRAAPPPEVASAGVDRPSPKRPDRPAAAAAPRAKPPPPTAVPSPAVPSKHVGAAVDLAISPRRPGGGGASVTPAESSLPVVSTPASAPPAGAQAAEAPIPAAPLPPAPAPAEPKAAAPRPRPAASPPPAAPAAAPPSTGPADGPEAGPGSVSPAAPPAPAVPGTAPAGAQEPAPAVEPSAPPAAAVFAKAAPPPSGEAPVAARPVPPPPAPQAAGPAPNSARPPVPSSVRPPPRGAASSSRPPPQAASSSSRPGEAGGAGGRPGVRPAAAAAAALPEGAVKAAGDGAVAGAGREAETREEGGEAPAPAVRSVVGDLAAVTGMATKGLERGVEGVKVITRIIGVASDSEDESGSGSGSEYTDSEYESEDDEAGEAREAARRAAQEARAVEAVRSAVKEVVSQLAALEMEEDALRGAGEGGEAERAAQFDKYRAQLAASTALLEGEMAAHVATRRGAMAKEAQYEARGAELGGLLAEAQRAYDAVMDEAEEVRAAYDAAEARRGACTQQAAAGRERLHALRMQLPGGRSADGAPGTAAAAARVAELRRERAHVEELLRAARDKMRRAGTASKPVPTAAETELEVRLRTVTERLIQQQASMEALASEKSTLVLRLDAAMTAMREDEVAAAQASALKGMSAKGAGAGGGLRSEKEEDEGEAKDKVRRHSRLVVSLSSLVGVEHAHKLANVWDALDDMSMGGGSFLGRNSSARMGFVGYMLLLHLWVLFVLVFAPGRVPDA